MHVAHMWINIKSSVHISVQFSSYISLIYICEAFNHFCHTMTFVVAAVAFKSISHSSEYNNKKTHTHTHTRMLTYEWREGKNGRKWRKSNSYKISRTRYYFVIVICSPFMNYGNDDIAHKLAAVHKGTEFIAVYLKAKDDEAQTQPCQNDVCMCVYFYGLGTNNHQAAAASFFPYHNAAQDTHIQPASMALSSHWHILCVQRMLQYIY